MSAALAVTSAVYFPVVPSALIALATASLDAFGVPAVPLNTSTFAGLASAGAAPSVSSAMSSANALSADRPIGGCAALRTSIRSSPPDPWDSDPAGRRYQGFGVRVN